MKNVNIPEQKLKKYVEAVFGKLGVPSQDARIAADILIQADLRGIESHGVARLKRYVTRLQQGLIVPKTQIATVKETSTTALLDGGNGLGQVVGYRAMELCIKKARQANVAWVAVRNSNHYGIAGYYAMMALSHNLIGFSMTNSRPVCVPTYSREALIGTNPFSFAAPAQRTRPFVLDMATSVVPIGKIETARRNNESIPLGWAVNKQGKPTTNPQEVLDNGGVLPLGGSAQFSGYKGYGLSVMIDILCSALTGASFLSFIERNLDAQAQPSNIGHFFGAIKIEAFRPLKEFTKTMEEIISLLKNSAQADEASRIWVAGEKEFEMEEKLRKNGIPVNDKILAEIRGIGDNLDVDCSLSYT